MIQTDSFFCSGFATIFNWKAPPSWFNDNPVWNATYTGYHPRGCADQKWKSPSTHTYFLPFSHNYYRYWHFFWWLQRNPIKTMIFLTILDYFVTIYDESRLTHVYRFEKIPISTDFAVKEYPFLHIFLWKKNPLI